MDRGETESRIKEVLRDACASAYWYGEDTGDYDMQSVDEEDSANHRTGWFREAVEKMMGVVKTVEDDTEERVYSRLEEDIA